MLVFGLYYIALYLLHLLSISAARSEVLPSSCDMPLIESFRAGKSRGGLRRESVGQLGADLRDIW